MRLTVDQIIGRHTALSESLESVEQAIKAVRNGDSNFANALLDKRHAVRVLVIEHQRINAELIEFKSKLMEEV